jgi:O-antigen/teichoic acid export membrane protein
VKDIFGTFFTTGGIQIVNVVTGVLAARLLLPEGRGELAILMLWPFLVADIGSITINASVGFHSARNVHSPKQIWAGTVILVTVLCPVLMAAFVLLIPSIYGGQRPEVISLAWLCTLLIPLHLYSLCLISQFQGVQDFSAYNVLRSLFHISYLFFICLLLLTSGRSLEAFAYSLVAANMLPLTVAVWLAWRRGWVSVKLPLQTIRELVMYGARSHVSVILGIANRRLDQAIISVALIATDLGLYVVAMTIQGLLVLVASTMDIMLFPKIAEQQVESARQEVLGRYFRATLVLVLPSAAFLLAFTPWLIEIVFGAPFVSATDVARILILTAIPLTMKIILSVYMRGCNKMKIITKGEGVGMVVTVAALAALLPMLGLVGAALAQLLALTIATVYIAWLIRRDTGLSLTGLFRFEKRDLLILDEAVARFRNRESG